MKHSLIIFILTLSLNFVAFAENSKQFDINGVIRNTSGQVVSGATVNLILIQMASPDKSASVSKIESDKDGAYFFKNQKVIEGSFYRVVAEKNGRDKSSEPFRQAREGNVITIDINLPDISSDSSKVSFNKEMLIFDLGKDYLRVTRIVNLVNGSNSIIELADKPINIELPANLDKLMILRQPEGSTYKIDGNQVIFSLRVKPGSHQIWFSYHLATDTSYQNIDHSVFPGLSEIEVISPVTGVTTELFPQGTAKITEQKRMFDKDVFLSKTIQLGTPRNSIKVKISGFPTSQYLMMIPAFIATCLLFIGLAVYIIRNAKKPAKK